MNSVMRTCGKRARPFRPQRSQFQARANGARIYTSIGDTAETTSILRERKWEAKWISRHTRIQEERESRLENDPLMPFYDDHIRKPTLLSTIQSIMYPEKPKKATQNRRISMLEHILNDCKCFKTNDSVLDYVKKYGTDVVRTSMLFNEGPDTYNDVSEESLILTESWFNCISNAVNLARESYLMTQAHGSLACPDVEDAQNPDLVDDFVDYELDHIHSFVHIVPDYPTPPGALPRGIYADEDTYALWLAAQEAILAMTRKMQVVDRQDALYRLKVLASSIAMTEYGGDDSGAYDSTNASVHYHSVRILLSLLAPVAPSLAEECWQALHYGVDDMERDREDILLEDLVEFDLQDLPRRNDPTTLSSIFVQPVPVPETRGAMQQIRAGASSSNLRRWAIEGAKEDMQHWNNSLIAATKS